MTIGSATIAVTAVSTTAAEPVLAPVIAESSNGPRVFGGGATWQLRPIGEEVTQIRVGTHED